ncbi:AAA family ATPase [uncultured Amnibacterium sp.]|uniref:AAA family ATPase n=1 Tax=uncultured Amnibacterium sp. TaxID=1631851 RepID=UPI0035C964EF
MIDAVFLNGTVGAGKTTVAEAVSALLTTSTSGTHAIVDIDGARGLRPSPVGDPFQHELELENLRDLARNYRHAGATRLVLAGVIESAVELPRYRAALGTDGLLVCRLTVRPEVAAARLAARHADDPEGRRRHLARTLELAAILDQADLDDVVLDASDESPVVLAQRVRSAASW